MTGWDISIGITRLGDAMILTLHSGAMSMSKRLTPQFARLYAKQLNDAADAIESLKPTITILKEE